MSYMSVSWFGKENEYELSVFAMILVLGPLFWVTVLSGAGCIAAAERHTTLNAPQNHANQLKKIQEAKSELSKSLAVIKSGISSITTLESQYKSKLEEFNKISEQLDDIRSAKGVDVAELQKQIDVLASASPKSRRPSVLSGILIGVIGSVVASAIWDYTENWRESLLEQNSIETSVQESQ